MTTDTDIAKLEQLFRAISVKNPKESALKKLREYPERDHCVQFLITKLRACHRMAEADDSWDNALEDGCIQACRVLGALKAEAAIDILIRTLDGVKHDVNLIMFSASLAALADIGPPVLEPVYAKYEEDQNNPDYATTWLDILSRIGVRDPRITKAMHTSFKFDAALTLYFIGCYGDRSFFPLVDAFVRVAAHHLNKRNIDPRAPFARAGDPRVGDYIDSREVLVRLRDDIDFEHPDFVRRVKALDDELLTTSEPWEIDTPDEPQTFVRSTPKIGRNDPCPCGSGKKFKKCCGQT